MPDVHVTEFIKSADGLELVLTGWGLPCVRVRARIRARARVR